MGVIGNHGRAGKRNMEKVRSNWDNMVFAIAEGRVSGHKNINFKYEPAWWATKKVLNTKFLLRHGDSMGKSINSLIASEQKAQSLLSGQTEPFDVMVAGHFHTHQEVETSRGRIILNGSFIGGDMYSMKTLNVRSRPTQTVMGVHPEHGITWKYCLNLEHPRDK